MCDSFYLYLNMEKAIIISRCSTNESRQDVTRQTQELTGKYGNQYDIITDIVLTIIAMVKRMAFSLARTPNWYTTL